MITHRRPTTDAPPHYTYRQVYRLNHAPTPEQQIGTVVSR